MSLKLFNRPSQRGWTELSLRRFNLNTDLSGASALVLCKTNNNVITRQHLKKKKATHTPEQSKSFDLFVPIEGSPHQMNSHGFFLPLIDWLILRQAPFLTPPLHLSWLVDQHNNERYSKSAPLRLLSRWHVLRTEHWTTSLTATRSKQESHFVDSRVVIPRLCQIFHWLLLSLSLPAIFTV